ncbi:hypothetical protein C4D60_Mb09t19370 [Musa balbisiana]|uniref:Uncharacterized protein n=1 Tax=Musa balbisiana TaxID=52838 RepID=A0A4S8IHM3_MUSBA|nr:hypothetical protein C4D60_Mb09t19370 [Musa balbisiana]
MTTRTQEVASTSAPLVEDQIRSYRRGQRRMFNARQAMRHAGQRILGNSSTRNILEQQIDPQTQLTLSMRERAAIAPAEVLYRSRRDDTHHRVYIHRSEESMLVTNNQEDRTFIQEESFDQLRRSRMQYIHLGILQAPRGFKFGLQILNSLGFPRLAVPPPVNVILTSDWRCHRLSMAVLQPVNFHIDSVLMVPPPELSGYGWCHCPNSRVLGGATARTLRCWAVPPPSPAVPLPYPRALDGATA